MPVQAYEEQTRELRVAVKAAHREGEYQASMAMRSLQEKMAVAMQRSDAATAQLAECVFPHDLEICKHEQGAGKAHPRVP